MLRKWGDIKWNDSINSLLKLLDDAVNENMKGFDKNKADFITEAVPKCDKDRRIDLIKLNDETWYEFETNKSVKKENCYTIYLK